MCPQSGDAGLVVVSMERSCRPYLVYCCVAVCKVLHATCSCSPTQMAMDTNFIQGAVTATNRCVIRKGISSQYHPLDIMETGWKHWPRGSKGLGTKFCSPKCINFTVINYSTTLNNICTIYYASLCYLLELMSYSTHILYEVCLRQYSLITLKPSIVNLNHPLDVDVF